MIRKLVHLIRLFIILILLTPILIQKSVFSFNTFTKYPQNPILTPTPNSFDSSRVWQPALLVDNSEYKILYSGFNGSRFQLGLAHSLDGFSWTKDVANPVISLSMLNNRDSHDPSIMKDGNYYISYFATSINGGSTDFSIYRAISPDGVNWTVNPDGAVFKPTSGWGSGAGDGVTSPFVLKVGNSYKMWFASNDLGHWQVGLATSSDGINWIPYEENPVLFKSETWEGLDTARIWASFDGTTYETFYSSAGKILYAYSTDGIHWIKPADKNPVLIPEPGTFAATGLGGPSGIKMQNGTTLLYYDGISLDGTPGIGFAYDGPLPSPFPTPTPTLTPTPTPLPASKVVVIPGFGASWNGDALLNCKSDGYQGDWVENPLATSIYQPLRDELSQNSFIPLSYFYDWRQQISTNTTPVAQFIQSNTIPNERVHMVGHSMGGLVGRAYLTDQGENNKLDHFMSAGSPHHGMVQAYPGWAAGEVWDDNFLFRVAMTTLLKMCQALYGTSDKVTVRQFVPSVQNLLPTFDYLRDKKTDQFKPVGSMQNQNNYLPTSFSSPFFGITFGTLGGTGQKTLQSMDVKDQNKKQLQDEVWTDGAPTKKNYSTDGDGTVLTTSSMVEGAVNTVVPQSHIGIVQSSQGIETILSFLGTPSPLSSVTLWEEPSSALVVMSYPSLFWVTEPNGKIYRDTDGIVAVINPKKGSYKLLFQPKTLSSKIIIAQFLADGRTFWKEYKHNLPLPKFGTISFDPAKPLEDILK